MDRNMIERSSLKKNFLKEIIVRLDFQGVLQAEMEEILLLVKSYLKKKTFDRYEEKTVNQLVKKDDLSADIKSRIVYCFFAEAAGYELKLSNTSVILSVRSQSYSKFEEYSAIFRQIANIYIDKITSFEVKRFGLRKINFCFIHNRCEINKYFVSSYYNIDSPIDNSRILANERVDKLSYGKNNVNLRYAIEEGKVGEEVIYKVSLDSDIYSVDKAEITDIIHDETYMKEINDKLFRIYINVLKDELIDILCSEDEVPVGTVLGVDFNE